MKEKDITKIESIVNKIKNRLKEGFVYSQEEENYYKRVLEIYETWNGLKILYTVFITKERTI